MENDYYEELQVPSGVLKSVIFKITSGSDTVRGSALTIGTPSEVSDVRLGLPNPTFQCPTCGAKNLKGCEGHYGCIKFPCAVLHPYFLPEVAKILNKICPGCKTIRQKRVKATTTPPENGAPQGCKYCLGTSVFWYPPMKFRVPSSKDLLKKTSIIVEARDKLPSNARRKAHRAELAPDYWDIIPTDPTRDESTDKPNRKVLSPAQVHHLLNGVDQKLIRKFIPFHESLFLNCFPVTPNCHRITDVCPGFSHRNRVVFDNRTSAYKKLVDFRGSANELGSRVLECLKISKLNPDKMSNTESAFAQKKKDSGFISYGLRWMKDVILGKRSNHCFRMVVVGNPNLELNEVGIPCYIAEKIQVSEILNRWNSEKLKTCVDLSFLERDRVFVRRSGGLVEIRRTTELQLGDTVYRPLIDGDTVLINRPPTIHQHSLIAMSIKVLPVSSCLSINPLCCSPLRGDFDGDCLHGYIPQSVEARVELKELAGLDKQLFNEQSGRNLLTFSQDSLLAAHLLLDSGIYLDRFQIQQLSMWTSGKMLPPAITKAPPSAGGGDDSGTWTGKQLFSMLLPRKFNWHHPANLVNIVDGEIVSSEGSAWLRDSNEGSLFQKLVKHCQGGILDFLHSAQEMLSEWLLMRGFSVSLSDLYLSSDPRSRENMVEEVSYALQDAELACNYRQLLVDSSRDFLSGIDDDENEESIDFDPARLCYEKQKLAVLTQGSADSFKRVVRDIQNLAYKYGSRDNSMLAMFKAGSKGNLLRVVQHSMCIGMQHSLVPLPFNFPHELSCSSWNAQWELNLAQIRRDSRFPLAFIPCAVVKNSFLSGLNPVESFVHSVTNRSSSFSENAEVPGTLHRKLMFFLRDVYVSYDGTVRNSYGNQVVEFEYYVDKSGKRESGDPVEGIGGSPVGSSSACALSEAAYSALDQPVSVLETSPLLNLKNVLECGSKKNKPDQTMSLFLSKRLGKQRHGFEYGALEVKDFLERQFFSDVLPTVMIIFSPANYKGELLSPWTCHFHIRKEILKKKGLTVTSIMRSLERRCSSKRSGSKANIPFMKIKSHHCSAVDKQKETHCITVSIVEKSKNASTPLTVVQNVVIPFLLGTVVKGFMEIKKVDIMWSERNTAPTSSRNSSGELCLRVSMSSHYGRMNLWSLLVNYCVEIMDSIDWTRSRPDNIADFSSVYGIDAGLKHFLNSLESAISDIGKTMLPEHLLLVGNALSTSGEFVGLNAKGIARQREIASVSSPFVHACFSTPGTCFIKAAKAGTVDNLHGSLDALAWGKMPSLGTGDLFDLVYSGKGHEISEPEDVYSLLKKTVPAKPSGKIDLPETQNDLPYMSGLRFTHKMENGAINGLKKLSSIAKSLRSFLSVNDVVKLSHGLRNILYDSKYSIDDHVGDRDRSLLMMALFFHPNRDQKIGSGAKDIKIGHHPKHNDSRCFMVVRNDGTVEDFSYHKCMYGALKIIAPLKAQKYQSRWLRHSDPVEG